MIRALSILLFLVPFQNSYCQTSEIITNGDSKIHLTSFGEGRPILIINGGPGMNSEGFAGLAEELSKNGMTIIYDQRGTGKSSLTSTTSETVNLDLMVNDIEAIRNHFGFKSWVILGHSFGGMLASYYATKHPKKLDGMILSSSGGIDMQLFNILNINGRLSKKNRDSLNYWQHRINSGDTTSHAKYERARNLAPAYLYNKSLVPKIAERLTQVDLRVNGLVFQSMRSMKFDCKEQLKLFKAPVLIIQGKDDIIPIEVSKKAHEVFPNSTLKTIERAAHYGWLENPSDYLGAIGEFFKNL